MPLRSSSGRSHTVPSITFCRLVVSHCVTPTLKRWGSWPPLLKGGVAKHVWANFKTSPHATEWVVD